MKPTKAPKKSKNIIFRDLKIRVGVLEVALKYFLLVFGTKFFRRPPLNPSYIGFNAKNRRGGIMCPPPIVIGLLINFEDLNDINDLDENDNDNFSGSAWRNSF